MSESTKRAVRTLYQGVLAALVIVPVLAAALADLDVEQLAPVAAALITGAAVVAKVVNALEDAGVLPAWLKAKPMEMPVIVRARLKVDVDRGDDAVR